MKIAKKFEQMNPFTDNKLWFERVKEYEDKTGNEHCMPIVSYDADGLFRIWRAKLVPETQQNERGQIKCDQYDVVPMDEAIKRFLASLGLNDSVAVISFASYQYIPVNDYIDVCLKASSNRTPEVSKVVRGH